MTRNTARTHVQAALADILRREPEALDEQDRLFEDLGLDSTTIIELLLSLEDRVDFEIDPDELGTEIFKSVGSLTDYVEAKLAGATQ
jgi:acyl carrier protein